MRGFIAWLAPAAATFVAWSLILGVDTGHQYSALQVVALVVVLIVLWAAFGWWAERVDLSAIVLSALVGVSAAAWQSWSGGSSGEFVIWWALVSVGGAIGSSLVVVAVWAFKESRTKRSGA